MSCSLKVGRGWISWKGENGRMVSFPSCDQTLFYQCQRELEEVRILQWKIQVLCLESLARGHELEESVQVRIRQFRILDCCHWIPKRMVNYVES